MTPNPFKEGLFKAKFQAVNGYIDVPQKPGLGVELKEGLEETISADSGQLEHARPGFPSVALDRLLPRRAIIENNGSDSSDWMYNR